MARDVLIPDPLISDRQYNRFYHLDLSDLEDTKLLDEYHYLRAHLWLLSSYDWLRERVKALETELIKRQGNTSNEFRARPKLKLAEGIKQ